MTNIIYGANLLFLVLGYFKFPIGGCLCHSFINTISYLYNNIFIPLTTHTSYLSPQAMMVSKNFCLVSKSHKWTQCSCTNLDVPWFLCKSTRYDIFFWVKFWATGVNNDKYEVCLNIDEFHQKLQYYPICNSFLQNIALSNILLSGRANKGS